MKAKESLVVVLKRMLLFVIVVALGFNISGCVSTSTPEKVTKTFFEAVKAGDLDKAVECYTPAIKAQYEAGLAITDGLFGFDSGAILGGLIGFANVDTYENYDFKISGTEMTDDEHATVSVDVYIDDVFSSSTHINCVKYDGVWYIAE